MTESRDRDGSRHASAEAEVRLLWESLGELLLELLARKFDLPPGDAGTLVQEAVLVYCRLDAPPPDAAAWLIAATCTSAEAYLHRRGLAGSDAAGDPRAMARSLFDPALLDALPERARNALRLRYVEGKMYGEIAEELGISPYAAERMVKMAMVRLRNVQRAVKLRV